MTLPDADQLRAAMEATWPASAEVDVGPFRLRRSNGGGQRVTAATASPGATDLAETLPRAEAQMLAWGQVPIFQVTPETPGLDALLDGAGYAIKDPVLIYAAPVAVVAAIPTPRLSTFAHWPPLAIQREIWEQGDIGADRVAVMDRVRAPKIAPMARRVDRPVGTAFAAIYDGIAMVHAIEVLADQRRQGDGRRLLSRAAKWAAEAGAHTIALAVTEANIGARALYGDLGMQAAARYHYRVRR